MKRWKLVLLVTTLAVATFGQRSTALAGAITVERVEICKDLYPADFFGVPNGEPLGVCQWDITLINASNMGFSFKVSSSLGPEEPPYTETEITSGEPAATAPDAEITDDRKVTQRTERSGEGDGRVYQIKITMAEAFGNTFRTSIPLNVNLSEPS